MRLPVILNSNLQIQDQDGMIVAELWKNPFALTDGALIMGFLNGLNINMVDPSCLNPEVKEETKAVDLEPLQKLEPLVIEPEPTQYDSSIEKSLVLEQAPRGVESPGSVLAPMAVVNGLPKRKGNPLFVRGQRNPYMRKSMK